MINQSGMYISYPNYGHTHYHCDHWFQRCDGCGVSYCSKCGRTFGGGGININTPFYLAGASIKASCHH